MVWFPAVQAVWMGKASPRPESGALKYTPSCRSCWALSCLCSSMAWCSCWWGALTGARSSARGPWERKANIFSGWDCCGRGRKERVVRLQVFAKLKWGEQRALRVCKACRTRDAIRIPRCVCCV